MDLLMDRAARIYVAGHAGLVGNAIVRALRQAGHTTVLTATRREVDLRDQAAVRRWFATYEPDYVLLVAGKVGGILANSTYPADFLYDNMMIHANVIDSSYRSGVSKLLYLGSSCIYPRLSPQPIDETQLLKGELEPTNEAYAIAKISGIKLAAAYRGQYGCDFISAMPTNLYGPNDNFDLTSSHVLPALIRKFHDAKVNGDPTVTIWGSGTPRREFMHVDDLAAACLFLMQRYSSDDHINIGVGSDVTIRELAELIREIVYPAARIELDTSKPDGMPRKLLDSSKLRGLGWRPSIGLRDGVASSYRWYVDHQANEFADVSR